MVSFSENTPVALASLIHNCTYTVSVAPSGALCTHPLSSPHAISSKGAGSRSSASARRSVHAWLPQSWPPSVSQERCSQYHSQLTAMDAGASSSGLDICEISHDQRVCDQEHWRRWSTLQRRGLTGEAKPPCSWEGRLRSPGCGEDTTKIPSKEVSSQWSFPSPQGNPFSMLQQCFSGNHFPASIDFYHLHWCPLENTNPARGACVPPTASFSGPTSRWCDSPMRLHVVNLAICTGVCVTPV